MKKLTVFVLAGVLAGACASTASTGIAAAKKERSLCSDIAVAQNDPNAEGLCTLKVMEANNERARMEGTLNINTYGGT